MMKLWKKLGRLFTRKRPCDEFSHKEKNITFWIYGYEYYTIYGVCDWDMLLDNIKDIGEIRRVYKIRRVYRCYDFLKEYINE